MSAARIALFLVLHVSNGQTLPKGTLIDQRPGSTKEVYDSIFQSIERLAGITFPSERQRQELDDLITQANLIFPTEPLTLFWKANLLERRADSEADLAKAKTLWQDALERLSNFGDVEEQIWARCYRRLGNLELAAGQAKKAAELATRGIALAPQDVGGYELLIDASYRTGDIFDTLEILRNTATRFGDQHDSIATLYLELLAEVGDWKTLRAQLDRRKKDIPNARDVHHFEGRLAEIESKPILAFAHHFIAMQNGEANRRPTRRSLQFVQRFYQLEEEELEGNLKSLVLAYGMSERKFMAEQAQQVLGNFEPSTATERIVADHLRAIALTNLGRIGEAAEPYRRILKTWPEYVPALCGLAEILESRGKIQESDRLFAKAHELRPWNRYVREIYRMGAIYQLTEQGVLVAEVEENSPWHDFGSKSGDIVLELDGESLGELAAFDRLRKARRFQGGEVTFRTKSGEVISKEMELVLFEY